MTVEATWSADQIFWETNWPPEGGGILAIRKFGGRHILKKYLLAITQWFIAGLERTCED